MLTCFLLTGSDIDTLIVAPKHVNRDDFFEHFLNILEKMSPPGALEEHTSVPDAHVPIIKLQYSGIDMDLIFVALKVASVPENKDLGDESLLRGMSEADLRSINGCRVTDEILSLVPQQKTFRHATRAIKLWAQRRAIYGNIDGFPGGVAWAMMVARVCQLYPYACGATIVAKFFNLMSQWPWPTPVFLQKIQHYEGGGPLQVRVWNPSIYNSDGAHKMPVITPVYPAMCATHSITSSTMTIILREMERANDITAKIAAGQLPWRALFEKHTYFTQGYKYYLSIVAASRTKEAQQIWSGFVHSKVRRLVSGIEMSGANVELAHPFIKGFERAHRCKNEEEVDMVLQGTLQFQATGTETTDSTKDAKQHAAAEEGGEKVEMPTGAAETTAEGVSTIYTTTFYVGIELQAGKYCQHLT